jgi:hypothetical protein
MPLLELPHWLMIAGVLLVIAGSLGLAFGRRNEVETEPVLLPGDLVEWKTEQPSMSSGTVSRKKRSRSDSQVMEEATEPVGSRPAR